MSDQQQLDMESLSRLPLGIGCAAVVSLIGAIVLGVVALFVLWQASDDAKLADDIAERGRLVSVEVTGKDITRSASGVNQTRTTQCWLLVAPTEDDPANSDGTDVRVAVSQTEYDTTAIGDSIEVWRVDDRYVLDRIVTNPTPPIVGSIILGTAAAASLATIILALIFIRRAKATTPLIGDSHLSQE